MGFEGFNIYKTDKNISENQNSENLNSLQNEIEKQISDGELKTEAQKELADFKKSIIDNKDGSQIILDDLKNELIEDLNSINNLEDIFGQKEGFNDFKKLFLSNNLSDEKREQLYDLIISGIFEKYINDELNGKLFPDIESIDDFLYEQNGKIENSDNGDSDILEIKNLDLDKLTINELKYFKRKISSLLGIAGEEDKKGLNEKEHKINDIINKLIAQEVGDEKGKIVGEESKIADEKGKIVGEKGKIVGEKQQKELIEKKLMQNKDPFCDIIDDAIKSGKIKDKEINGESISEKIKKIRNSKEINSFTDELKNELVSYILKGDNLKKILSEAKEKGKYAEVYNFIESLAKSNDSSSGNLLLQKLENTVLDIEKYSISTNSLVRNKEIENFFGQENGISRNGNKYILGDKLVDFSDKPPKYYLITENGYKLKTENQKIENTNEILEKRQELQKIKLNLEKIGADINHKLNKIEELKKIPEKDRNENQNKEIAELKKDVEKLKENIIKEVEKAEKIKKELDDMDKKGILFDINKEKEMKEKQEKTKDILKFLHSIGFDLINQDITNAIIEYVNSNRSSLAKEFPNLKGDIDLEKGKLGFDYDAGNNNSLHPKEMLDFIRLFNKMLTGDINKPNTINGDGFVSFFKPDEIKKIRDNFTFGTEKSEMIENLKK